MDGNKKSKMELSLPIILVLFLFNSCSSQVSNQHRIKLENGVYNGTVIAIDGDKIKETDCAVIIQRTKEVLAEFSKKLHQTTRGRATLGQVDLLLPPHWSRDHCPSGEHIPKTDRHSYEASHIRITEDHPLAKDLLWTKQYRECGQSSDLIIFPLSFLLSGNFTNGFKGLLLLHEWTKFRYGAFDEIGYSGGENDAFPACYTHFNQGHLTSCTNPRLPAIVVNASVCSIDVITGQGRFLGEKISQSTSSVMALALPNIDLENDSVDYCNETTHSFLPITKQNVYCGKSVLEVVNSHPDFSGENISPGPEVGVSKADENFQLRVFQAYDWTPFARYCFIIEDTPSMREDYKLLHVQQAIAQFLQILDTEVKAKVYLVLFSDTDGLQDCEATDLDGDERKVGFLNKIMNRTLNSCKSHEEIQGLNSTMDHVHRSLEKLTGTETSWNVFLFTDSTEKNEQEIPAAVLFSREFKYPLSVFTFESSSVAATPTPTNDAWLLWYGIANTRNVLVLPFCSHELIGGPCSLQTSTFILDYLTSYLNDRQFHSQFIQKVAQVNIENKPGQTATFTLDASIEPSIVKNIHFFMSLPEELQENPSNFIKFITPTANGCSATRLLTLGHVIFFSGSNCRFLSGLWTVQLDRQIPPPGVNSLILNVFLEYFKDHAPERFIVTPSLGLTDTNMTQPFSPNQSPHLVPIFVSVDTDKGNPVLNAQVSIKVYHPRLFAVGTGNSITPRQITLQDNGDTGNAADETGNDGIYSGFITGFSETTATYHLVEILVTGGKSQGTQILQEIESPGAILLDTRLREKCCGKMIRPKNTTELKYPLRFQSLHLGFKTTEAWNKSALPPGPIQDITVYEQTKNSVTFGFLNVPGDLLNDTVLVKAIQACCAPYFEETTVSAALDELNCSPQTFAECGEFSGTNEPQNCSLNTKTLVTNFVPTDDLSRAKLLTCGLRAVNSNSVMSSLSAKSFEVDVKAAIVSIQEGDPTCDKISDGCLPIWVFWTLIGIVGLLVLIIILICITCFFCCRKGRKQKENIPKNKNQEPQPPKPTPRSRSASRKEVSFSTEIQGQQPPQANENQNDFSFTPVVTSTTSNPNNKPDSEEPKVVKELFINHAYIQDADGEVKIITDNGKILTKPMGPQREFNSSPAAPTTTTNFRRLGDPTIMAIRSTSPPPPRSPSVAAHDNMQVFKPMYKDEPQRTKQRPRSKPHPHQRPKIVHPNPMLRSDSAQSFQPEMQQQERSMSPSPPPRTPPSLNYHHQRQQSHYHPSTDPGLVYATVSRSGRLKPSPLSLVPEKPYGTVRNPPKSTTELSPHYMTPHNTPSRFPGQGQSQGQRGGIPNFSEQRVPTPAPPQVLPFPSDTESMSSVDHQALKRPMRPPKFVKPPPYPNGSQFATENEKRPVTTGRKSPAPISSPPPPPPVAPPRYTTSTNSGSQLPPQPLHRSLAMVPSSEEDSDNWDDGDYNYEFENTTGVSHA